MQKSAWKIALVAVIQLGLFEALLQFSVHWGESAEETGSLVLWLGMLAGSIWATLTTFCEFRAPMKHVMRVFAGVVLFAALYAGDYVYYWHLRPNLGLYQEPDWVQQHPGYQRELRQRIENNKWKS